MSNQSWYLRNVRPSNPEKTKGYCFVINDSDEFDIDEEKWKDFKVEFEVMEGPDPCDPITELKVQRHVIFNVPSANIELSMALATLKRDLTVILAGHMNPILEVYGPEAEAKAKAAEAAAGSSKG